MAGRTGFEPSSLNQSAILNYSILSTITTGGSFHGVPPISSDFISPDTLETHCRMGMLVALAIGGSQLSYLFDRLKSDQGTVGVIVIREREESRGAVSRLERPG